MCLGLWGSVGASDSGWKIWCGDAFPGGGLRGSRPAESLSRTVSAGGVAKAVAAPTAVPGPWAALRSALGWPDNRPREILGTTNSVASLEAPAAIGRIWCCGHRLGMVGRDAPPDKGFRSPAIS